MYRLYTSEKDSVNDNAYKNKTIDVVDMNEDDFKRLWDQYKRKHSITIDPTESRRGVNVRIKPSYHTLVSYYAKINDMTIGEFYEKAAILYMKNNPKKGIIFGDSLDEL